MNIFGLFLKKLAIDTSAEEIRRITNILDQNHLKYEVRTARARGAVGSALDAGVYARANLAMYKGASQPTFIYTVYVNRQDFERARKLTVG